MMKDRVIQIDRYKSGELLYGDDFTKEEIDLWHNEERMGYFDLVGGGQDFPYREFSKYHFFQKLSQRFPVCLALGCADGADVAGLSTRVERFIAIEPAQEWWSSAIAEKPAEYMMPNADGRLSLESDSVDVAVSFGVLHHIPNVTAVLKELNRVLKPDSLLLIREPCSSMGDWRSPRRGLTRHERGIAKAWMLATAHKLNLEVVSVRPCISPFTTRVSRVFGVRQPFQSPLWVRVDAVLARLFQPFDRYWRERQWQKIGPSSYAYIFRKPA